MGALSLTDITNSIKNPKVCFKDNNLKQAIPIMFNGRPICFSGNYGAVFKFRCGTSEKAVRIWTKDLQIMPELPARSKVLSEKIRQIDNPCFIDFDFQDQGLLVSGMWTPIVIMDWCSGKNLKDAISENLYDPDALKLIASNFLELIRLLHKQGISHGDLQHGNILIGQDYSIKLIDYDSLYIPCKEFERKIEEIKGLPDYQHPLRMKNMYANSKVDYFSELIIYLSLCALIEAPHLWKKYNIANRDYSLLFDQNDFADFQNSRIYADLISLSDTIKKLTKILVKYLNCSDINILKPFDEEAYNISCSLYSNVIESLYCINCGSEFISPDDAFCVNCGTRRYK